MGEHFYKLYAVAPPTGDLHGQHVFRTFGDSMDPLDGVLGRVEEDIESLLLDVEWFMLARPDWV